MNTLLNRVDYHKSIQRILQNSNNAIEGKAVLVAALDKYNSNIDRLGELTSDLVYPVTFVRKDRIELHKQLRSELARIANTGCLLAKKLNDSAMLSKMKQYRAMASKFSIFVLYESAFDIAGVFEANSIHYADIGCTAEEITAFKDQAQQLSDKVNDVRGQLDDRRRNRHETRALVKECNRLLIEHFDPFVKAQANAQPDFATAYAVQRALATGGKHKKGTMEETAEISGTVSDLKTSAPLANATVTIADLNLVAKTDNEGNYSFEELPPTDCTIECSLPGYETPEKQTLSVNAGDVLLADFSLKPSQEAQT